MSRWAMSRRRVGNLTLSVFCLFFFGEALHFIRWRMGGNAAPLSPAIFWALVATSPLLMAFYGSILLLRRAALRSGAPRK